MIIDRKKYRYNIPSLNVLSSEMFSLNQALIPRIKTLNSMKVQNILKQANYLKSVEIASFWKAISINQNINYTAFKLL